LSDNTNACHHSTTSKGGVSHGKKEKGRQEDQKDSEAQSRKEDREEAPLV
jgi:hypothetical protein